MTQKDEGQKIGRNNSPYRETSSAPDLSHSSQNSGDWEARLTKIIPVITGEFTTLHKDNLFDFVRTKIDRAREEAYAEGQKHAFGVDRKRVFEEGREDLKKELRRQINAMKAGACSSGQCGHLILDRSSADHGAYIGHNDALDDVLNLL